jgi:hypothetical protein
MYDAYPQPLSTRPIGDKTYIKWIKVSLSCGIIILISTIIPNALTKMPDGLSNDEIIKL